MTNLNSLIKETEKLGITVLKAELPESKGRHLEYEDLKIIYLDKNLDEIQAINVLLHERSHFLSNDLESSLSHISTYSHRIESRAEKDRIIDFLSLINQEYPIDESFNYLKHMEIAKIEPRFEQFVKKSAKRIYKQNKKIL